MNSVYIIKKVSDMTQDQLNLGGVRSTSNVRTSTDGYGVLEVSPEIAKEFFLFERWYTLEEAQAETAAGKWNGEAPEGFLSRALSAMGIR
jgi:hypothetical protein